MSPITDQRDEDRWALQQCVLGDTQGVTFLRDKCQPVLVNVLVARGAYQALADKLFGSVQFRAARSHAETHRAGGAKFLWVEFRNRLRDNIVKNVSRSMMRHGATLWGAALYNNGAYPAKNYRFGQAYADDGEPLRLESPVSVKAGNEGEN